MSHTADDPDRRGPAHYTDSSRPLGETATRALAEAAERRAKRVLPPDQSMNQREINGRAGPDPVRYGDWENNGLASDF
ncbi:MAG: DUF1674 domain-containing protein [Hyphomicrobiales bacterium]